MMIAFLVWLAVGLLVVVFVYVAAWSMAWNRYHDPHYLGGWRGKPWTERIEVRPKLWRWPPR